MSEEIEKLFCYKGKDILIKRRKEKYQMGMRNQGGVDIWFDKVKYNSLQLARTRGRDYARTIIDRLILNRKE